MKIKAAVLITLVAILITIIFLFDTSPNRGDKEKAIIIEKYYPITSDDKAVGFKTEKSIEVPVNENGYSCAMEFDNEKVLALDCKTYLNYKVDETVYITYEGNEITEIRRKR